MESSREVKNERGKKGQPKVLVAGQAVASSHDDGVVISVNQSPPLSPSAGSVQEDKSISSTHEEPDHVEIPAFETPAIYYSPKQPQKLHPIQVAIQYTQRFLDATAFGAGMGPHTLGRAIKPYPALEIMMMTFGAPGNDLLGEKLLVPLALKHHPFSRIKAEIRTDGEFTKGFKAQFLSLALTAAVGYSAGLVLGAPFQHWISTAEGGAKFVRILGSAVGLGLAGSAIKAALLTFSHPKSRDLLTAEPKDDPRTLLQAQHVYHDYILSYSANFAWTAAVYDGLKMTGHAAIANHFAFAPLALCTADWIRRSMIHFGHAPDPFAKLVPKSQWPEPALQPLDANSELGSPVNDRLLGFDSLDAVAKAEADAMRGETDGGLLDTVPDAAPSVPTRPTKGQIAKVVVAHMATCATSAGLVVLANYFFVRDGKKYNEADRDPNLEGHNSFGIRMALDFGRYASYLILNEGISRLGSVAVNRFSQWRSGERVSGSVQDQDQNSVLVRTTPAPIL